MFFDDKNVKTNPGGERITIEPLIDNVTNIAKVLSDIRAEKMWYKLMI